MPEPLKNFYSPAYLAGLSSTLKQAYPELNANAFQKSVLHADWSEMELKQRMQHIARCLHQFLPDDYRAAIKVLKAASASMPPDPNSGFLDMYYPEFVSMYGQTDWKTSLPALKHFTRFASSEFAVRPFIIADPDRMMSQMKKWSTDKNHHVRRLSSEGCRPRLPWAMALPLFKQDPTPVLELLETLKADPEKYVQKSVANNLNDIAKDHPERVIKTVKAWQNHSEQTDWILKHACRTLLKQSHPEALGLFGFKTNVKSVSSLNLLQDRIRLGEKLQFAFSIELPRRARLRIEYLIHYMKKNGQTAPKVFLLSEKEFGAGKHHLEQSHLFQQMTTRQHYPGEHAVTIRINGREKCEARFELEM